MDDRCRRWHCAKPCTDLESVFGLQRFEVCDEKVAAGGSSEVPDVALNRPSSQILIDVATCQIGLEYTEQPCGGKMARQW